MQARQNVRIVYALANQHPLSVEDRIRTVLEIAHIQVLLAIHDQLEKICTCLGEPPPKK